MTSTVLRATARVLALAALALLGACGGSGSTPADVGPDAQCTPPDAVTYACDPIPASEVGCSGSPMFGSTPLTVPDPTLNFPPGCAVSFPRCHPAFPFSVERCFCEALGDGDAGRTAAWTCPL